MPPSYVAGNSYQLNWLTAAEREFLDMQPWVFAVNEFLEHWEKAGFRPSVWLYGDNHCAGNVEVLAAQLAKIRRDKQLRERPVWRFAALESCAALAHRVVDASGLTVRYYRRGDPWRDGQEPATSIDGRIYHYGSTLTDAVNIAWLMNPGEEIRIFSNPYGPRWGHFWHPPEVEAPTAEGRAIWTEVMDYMWRGLSELHHKHGLPIVDCNAEHEAKLPCKALPRKRLRD